MNLGILFTVFISFSIGIFAFWQVVVLYRKKNHILISLIDGAKLFSLIWFIMGIVWWLVAISDFFAWNGELIISKNIVQVFQALIGFDLILIWRFFIMYLFPRKYWRSLLLPHISAAILFEWSLIKFELVWRPFSFFSTQFILNPISQFLFAIVFIPSFLAALYHIITKMFKFKRLSMGSKFILISSFSLALLGVGGAFEEFGGIVDATVQLSRIGVVIAAMVGNVAINYAVTTKKNKAEMEI